jgi:DNA-directed RNA polymerase specialized sigma24 family protein
MRAVATHLFDWAADPLAATTAWFTTGAHRRAVDELRMLRGNAEEVFDGTDDLRRRTATGPPQTLNNARERSRRTSVVDRFG